MKWAEHIRLSFGFHLSLFMGCSHEAPRSGSAGKRCILTVESKLVPERRLQPGTLQHVPLLGRRRFVCKYISVGEFNLIAKRQETYETKDKLRRGHSGEEPQSETDRKSPWTLSGLSDWWRPRDEL
ncbi:hypothetical protein ISCGN_003515 [Ixodes scapularis]